MNGYRLPIRGPRRDLEWKIDPRTGIWKHPGQIGHRAYQRPVPVGAVNVDLQKRVHR
jgi:hypothetical protein